MNNSTGQTKQRSGFTLIEMLVAITIVGVLASLLMSVLMKAREVAKGVYCANSLRQLAIATHLYLQDHNNVFFPYYTDTTQGRVWYFGLEPTSSLGGSEGDRTVDTTQGALYPYIQTVGGIQICPSFPYGSSYWKPKFKGASFGYGYNLFLATNTAVSPPKMNQPKSLMQISAPDRVILFVDCAQVNTFQAPASATNPMLEEFYFIDDTYQTVHFRHNNLANILFVDGHVEKFKMYPGTQASALPSANVGRITARGSTQYLQ